MLAVRGAFLARVGPFLVQRCSHRRLLPHESGRLHEMAPWQASQIYCVSRLAVALHGSHQARRVAVDLVVSVSRQAVQRITSFPCFDFGFHQQVRRLKGGATFKIYFFCLRFLMICLRVFWFS